MYGTYIGYANRWLEISTNSNIKISLLPEAFLLVLALEKAWEISTSRSFPVSNADTFTSKQTGTSILFSAHWQLFQVIKRVEIKDSLRTRGESVTTEDYEKSVIWGELRKRASRYLLVALHATQSKERGTLYAWGGYVRHTGYHRLPNIFRRKKTSSKLDFLKRGLFQYETRTDKLRE